MRKFLWIAVALLLSGCMVGPNYTRPEIEAPENWTISYDAAAGLADTAWWEHFDDPILNDLIKTALKQNLDLQIATARIDRYIGQLQSSRAALFPQIGAMGGVSSQQDTKTGLAPPRDSYEYYEANLNVSWELDLWGRIRRANEAARAELLASEEGRRAVLLTLVSNVAGGYLNLRGLDRQLEIARETEKNYADSLRIFRLRHDHGTVSLVEVSQVESEYETARQAIPQIEARIGFQEHLLSLLLGTNPKSIPRGQQIDAMVPPGIPAGLPSSLLIRRPDILQAEQVLVAANARIGVARSLYFPDVSLTGLLGVASVNADDLFTADSKVWQANGLLLAPIFTFGSIEGKVQVSEAMQREALFTYQQVILNAFREVEDALTDTIKGREQLASLGRQVEVLKTYARLARLQYEAGTAGYLQVLDANRTLFNGQLAHAQSQAATLAAVVNVYRAMGGGWVTVAEDLSGMVKSGN
jgi:multidrug efflux system outer membrane protein